MMARSTVLAATLAAAAWVSGSGCSGVPGMPSIERVDPRARARVFAEQATMEAQAAEARGDNVAALRAWQQVAAVQPGPGVAAQARRLRRAMRAQSNAELARAAALARNGRRREARAVALHALASDPEHAALRRWLSR